jgi:hypothetical protein
MALHFCSNNSGAGDSETMRRISQSPILHPEGLARGHYRGELEVSKAAVLSWQGIGSTPERQLRRNLVQVGA